MRPKNKIEFLIMYLLVMALCFTVFGCRSTDKAIVRYQDVDIPYYERVDYEKMLTSKEHEVKYNAICNLISYASEYADHLDKRFSKKTSQEDNAKAYKKAQRVFDTIRTALRSENDNIMAASLMFMAEFSSTYADKKELFTLVSQVTTNDSRTQYEQIKTLLHLVDSNSNLDKSLIEKYLDSKSWLIRSMTYRLLAKIVCEDFHARLIHDYTHATQEYDKLLIVHAIGHQYGAEVFNLLKGELLQSKTPRIQMAIAETLPGARDETAVGKWIVEHHGQLNEDVLKHMIDQFSFEMKESAEMTFFGILLDSNQPQLTSLIAQSTFFEDLYNCLKRKNPSNNLIDLRNIVQQNDSLKVMWNEYKVARLKKKDQAKKDDALEREIIPKYTEMLETFLKKSMKLFADSGMDSEDIEKETESIRELLQIFKKEQEE